MRIDDLLGRLEGVTGNAPQWYARCPAHEDRRASLSVALGRDGRILVSCWAECGLEAICAGVGIAVSDLFDQEAKQRESLGLGLALANALKPKLPTEAEIVADVVRLHENTPVLQEVARLKGWQANTLAALDIGYRGSRLTIPVRDLHDQTVQFLRYWPASQPKMIATKGHPRTPYYMVRGEGDVWIVEGETDAISVAHAGFDVIGAPGASAKPKAEWLEPVRGRRAIVCFDHDEPGDKAAARWAHTAANRGASAVLMVRLGGRKGYDVSDLLLELGGDARLFRHRLAELAQAAEAYEPPARDAPAPTPTPDINGVEPGELVLTPLSSYRVTRLRMLWRNRIPVGRVGIVFGPPGLGKSTVLALIAADVTRAGGRVLVASAEDSPATTLMPRMIAAGADIGLIDVISTKAKDGDTGLVLPRDLKTVERHMVGCALLVIDPISAHLGDEINEWKEQDIRAQVLAPLAKYSDETGCAIVLIKHPNRSDGKDPLSRISGSGGFGAAARFVLLLGTHPDDVGLDPEDRRPVLVHVKASETAKQPAMVFRRRVVGVNGEDGATAVPMLELLDDRTFIAPESVLEHTDPDEAGAFSEAIEFLRHELVDGPKLAKRLLATARERGDFSERTLRRAKRALKVDSRKDQDGWRWERRP